MRKLSILLLGVCFATYLSGQIDGDRLTPEKLWEIGRVGLDDVSPDGKLVLYGVTYFALEENKGNRDLYIVPSKGGLVRKVTSFVGSEYNARFRPDGEKIGFISATSGSPQMWEMSIDGLDKKQVTEIEGGISGFSYSPSGDHILFTADVKLDEDIHDMYPDLPHANARIIDDLMYRHWNHWHDYKYGHVFYAPYNNGKVGDAVDIMEGERYDSPMNPFGGISEIAWSPDGETIAYTCKKMTGKDYAVSTNSDIYLYNVKSGRTENLTDGMMGYDRDPAFSPDGKYIAWNSMERDGFESDRNRVFIYNFETKQKTELTEGLDRNVDHPHWSKDSRRIYATSGFEATIQLCSIDVNSKKFAQITEGNHNYYTFKVMEKGLIGLRVSMSMPAELYYVAGNGRSTQITEVNKELLSTLKMGKVEARTIKTVDKKDMLAWVIYPPDFDPAKKYPTLLYCQGGPQSAVSQFFSYRWNFQLMAANGYIVVAPNRRGLPSFGRHWNDEISKNWGGMAMQDYLSAIDEVSKEPYVDKNKMGAVGASFGGYSVYWLAGNHDKRFKAFISHCGLFNLESWYGTTEEMFFANWDIGGSYWDERMPKSYKLDSPHDYVKYWDTPMLVIHGEKDFRVPIGEGMQAFNAAQLKGVESRFLYYPTEGHWVLSPQNGVLWHRVFFDWLDTHLK